MFKCINSYTKGNNIKNDEVLIDCKCEAIKNPKTIVRMLIIVCIYPEVI